MNDGHVIVCDSCERPFEILTEFYGSEVMCPYCKAELRAVSF